MAHVHQSERGQFPKRRLVQNQPPEATIRLQPLARLLMTFVLLTSVGAVACSRKMEAPPASALKQASQDSKLDRDHLELERRHVAPPPAYGNKVVLAEAAVPATVQF